MSWRSETQPRKTDSVMERGIYACGCQGPKKDKKARSLRQEGPPSGSFGAKSCYQNGSRGSQKNPTSRWCAFHTRPRWKMTIDFKMVLVLISLFWLSCMEGFESKSCTDHKKIFTTTTGMIQDGPGLYANGIRCEWLIRAPHRNQSVTITVTKLKMECNYDYLYIFDGPSYNSKLLASLTGYDPPGQITSTSHEIFPKSYSVSCKNTCNGKCQVCHQIVEVFFAKCIVLD